MTLPTSSPTAPSPALAPTADAPARVTTVVRPGEGRGVRAFGNEILFKLGTEQTGGAFALGLASVPPGGGPPPHVHDGDDETFIIVEGTYRVFVDGTWHEAPPGTVVFLPRGSVHTFHVAGDAPGKHWVLTTPSGFERYFAQVAAEVFAAPGPPDRARLAEIGAGYGYRIA